MTAVKIIALVLMAVVGMSLSWYIVGALVWAWIEERGRYSYTPYRRALRTLARTNPRRSKP